MLLQVFVVLCLFMLALLKDVEGLPAAKSQYPVPVEVEVIKGVETLVSWPLSPHPQAVILLFHGCYCQGADWFRKPEEVRFTRVAQALGIPLVAFTNPRHLGNFCWPSQSSDFEAAADSVRDALAQILRRRLPEGAQGSELRLLLVGGSSGGNFASRLTSRWDGEDGQELKGFAKIAALIMVVSPTHLVQRGQLEAKPPGDFPPTGFVYMPRDKGFASKAAIEVAMGLFRDIGVPSQAWAVGPFPVRYGEFATSLREAGVAVQDSAAMNFCEELTQLGLLAQDGEVLEDPRLFPWHRVSWRLTEGLGLSDRSADPEREQRIRSVEELLNRAWAVHEFAIGDTELAKEVIGWLLAQPAQRSSNKVARNHVEL